MWSALGEVLQAVMGMLAAAIRGLGRIAGGVIEGLGRMRIGLLLLAALGSIGYLLLRHPPVQTLAPGEIGFRSNRWSGGVSEFRHSPVWVLPGLHEIRRHSLRDRVYRPVESASAEGAAPFQSLEGLSVGVDLSLRYALDPKQLPRLAAQLPPDLDHEVVEPAVQGVIYKTFARYTVREIFSSKRAEIQQAIESELKPRLAADGILLRGVQIGRIDLPADYRAGMEKLLAEELESEKMRYTLALKDQQVKQSALEAEAQKVRREKEAEAAASEQIIAARAQEEAMKHVLPFKQKQIEQRQLEAEADKQSRIRNAEGTAAARRIEAAGEADSRQKLADAEGYRLEQLGRITSAQLERDGALLTKHPLLIQKTMADKLSDKVSVIIAPPSTSGGFIGSALLGQAPAAPQSYNE